MTDDGYLVCEKCGVVFDKYSCVMRRRLYNNIIKYRCPLCKKITVEYL